VVTPSAGLRQRKKQATRNALREAALRLALERGPDNVRVEDIAEAAGVSPRTYNNYFSSRQQAVVAAISAEREARIAAAVAARPSHVPLAVAIIDAITEQYSNPAEHHRHLLLLITTDARLRDAFLHTAADIEYPLTAVIAERLGDHDPHAARVLAASVAAAVRIALERWVHPTDASGSASQLVIPVGSLPDLLRASLEPLTPALHAAERRPKQR
jgi:AcrR family transcriptional regulator